MWNLISKKGFPRMNARWCCEELKEYGGAGRYCVTGVRWAESPQRKKTRSAHELIAKSMAEKISLNNDNDMKRKLSEICLQKRKFMLNPCNISPKIGIFCMKNRNSELAFLYSK
jgi:phosphoadenosine phosphosulfate reductase